MKEIGGFFELELDKKEEFYPEAVKVNSGRNAIQYVLKTRNVEKVYVPYFTCETVVEPVETLGIPFEFYSIDENLQIVGIDPESVIKNEKIIYINYFGLKNDYVEKLAEKFGDRLLVDNTQAFYAKPLEGIDTCYSPRKFFGVPDGGYAFTEDHTFQESLEREISYDTFTCLLGRIDKSASEFYQTYCRHNDSMIGRPLKRMSKITEDILSSINYEKIRLIRERNFLYIHNRLKASNRLDIDISSLEGPMVYPFWTDDEGLRSHLIQNRVYVATYWPEVLEYVKHAECVESDLTKKMLALPIDQRYTLEDMQRILDLIEEYGEKEKNHA